MSYLKFNAALFQENEDTKITGKLVCIIILVPSLVPRYPRQFHGMKEVKKAAKKAKVFEARKIVKKLKEFVCFFIDPSFLVIS